MFTPCVLRSSPCLLTELLLLFMLLPFVATLLAPLLHDAFSIMPALWMVL